MLTWTKVVCGDDNNDNHDNHDHKHYNDDDEIYNEANNNDDALSRWFFFRVTIKFCRKTKKLQAT